MKDFETRLNYESKMEHDKWLSEIPFFKVPDGCEIKVTPPFGGAVVRFLIKKGDCQLSIYLDCYDNLGAVGQPYWEIYPYENDVFRCYMNDVSELEMAIHDSLSSKK